MFPRNLLSFMLGAVATGTALAISPTVASTARSVPLDLSPYYNNKAFGTYPGETSFDGLGQCYPAPNLTTPFYTSSQTGILYSFPGYTGLNKTDNVVCSSQTITVSNDSYFSASFLTSGDKELHTISENVTFTYTDNSTSLYELRTQDWFSFLTLYRGELIFPSRFTATGVDYNTSHIFERTAALIPGKILRSITLPNTTDASEGRLHIFSFSLWSGSSAEVQSVRPTQKWLEAGVQAVEVTVNNAGSECVSGSGLVFSLVGEGFNTTKTGSLKRLCPGDQKTVAIGVEGSTNGSANVSVIIDDGVRQRTAPVEGVEIGFIEWTTELDDLAKHETPDWFNDAKYGIFIHWGPYAVAGWGNSTPYESYAEWFWWYSTHHPQADPSDFYDYRLRTYGEDWAYDDTFPDFTASAFDPKEWVDLFADAGATYFVITSKHHDGFALFDTGETSNRSALHYGPRRDLLGELFDAAATYQPDLKRGAYFSLPEWYNPDFGPYGFDQFNSSSVPATNSWPGVLAKNPYTGVEEPYTGHVPVVDFLENLMLPQMETLAYEYDIDIMWCDIGGPNITAPFAARWWNETRAKDRQVAINSRCGLAQAADFDTPEYATFSSAQARKWESNRGMDPYSYGYNSATRAKEYMNASTLIYSLVDIVSKNGNFLLDIGPRADGSIVQAEADNLRDAGLWIKDHGEAIFGTNYWFVQSEIVGGPDVRFTQTDGAFYALFLERPVVEDGVVSIAAPVPILDGDEVSLVAIEGGEDLSWSVSGKGTEMMLQVEVHEGVLDKAEFCWVFKIKYA
ncbi:Uu.00g135620.m01.CDS01 [Anthostomella pinea]|uniref:alpha-L-fucosidase n=1 Tax=Anthostomella pinea TaxID=933095 RepID=A0AAI8YKW9_9PEZI|nr:Uu.00g135620.m01.CDS01 [Anthostomella pinea]